MRYGSPVDQSKKKGDLIIKITKHARRNKSDKNSPTALAQPLQKLAQKDLTGKKVIAERRSMKLD